MCLWLCLGLLIEFMELKWYLKKLYLYFQAFGTKMYLSLLSFCLTCRPSLYMPARYASSKDLELACLAFDIYLVNKLASVLQLVLGQSFNASALVKVSFSSVVLVFDVLEFELSPKTNFQFSILNTFILRFCNLLINHSWLYVYFRRQLFKYHCVANFSFFLTFGKVYLYQSIDCFDRIGFDFSLPKSLSIRLMSSTFKCGKVSYIVSLVKTNLHF